MDALDLVLQAAAGDGVHGAERLVGQQDVGAGRQRAGDADALRLSARQLGGIAIHDVVRQPDDVHPFRDGLLGATLVAAVQQRGHVRDVLLHGEVGKQHAALDGVADVSAQLDGVDAARVLPVHQHASIVGHRQRVHHFQQRGLAAARAADDGDERAFVDVEVRVVHGDGIAESLADVLERDGGCGAFFCWRRTGSFDFALRAPLRMTNRETLGTSHPVIPSAGDGVAGVATRS